MKRIAAFIVVLLLCFYVAWPAWSGYAIRGALQAQDSNALAAKVDFDRVQASLRPIVAEKVEEGVDRYQSQLGPAGAIIIGQLKKDALPRIVDASLRALVKPEMIIRVASEAGPIKETIERILREQMGRSVPGTAESSGSAAPPQSLGGLIGKALKGAGGQPAVAGPGQEAPAASTPSAMPPKRTYSLANVKRFAYTGPLSFQVGLAKDPASVDADVTVEMSFTGLDWKITGLIPRV